MPLVQVGAKVTQEVKDFYSKLAEDNLSNPSAIVSEILTQFKEKYERSNS